MAVMELNRIFQLVLGRAALDEFWGELSRARDSGATSEELLELENHIMAAVALREQLDQHRRREASLAALYETAVDLTALHDGEAVLKAIVGRAQQLLTADTAYMTLNDKESNETFMRVSAGTIDPNFDSIRLPFGHGIGGVVAQTAAPYFTQNYARDTRLNHLGVVDGIVHDEGLVAILGVPIRRANENVGVLFAADRRERIFLPEEVNLLSSLAALAAVALHNASLIEELHGVVGELERSNAAVQERSESIERAATAHERFTDVLAQGGDLADLTRTLAEVLESTALVLDGHARRVAVSGPLSDEDSLSITSPTAFDELVDHGLTVVRDGWSITPIATSGLALGALAIASTDLSGVEQRTLERAAQVAAGMILNDRAKLEAQDQVRGELLEELLHPERLDVLSAQRRSLRVGVDLRQPLIAATWHVEDAGISRVLSTMRDAARSEGGLVGRFEDLVAMLLPEEGADESVRRLADRITERTGATCTVARSATLVDVTQVRAAVESAGQVTRALVGLGRRGAIADAADLGYFRLLLTGKRPEDIRTFVDAWLEPLIEHDAHRGTHLLESVDAYLRSQGTVTAAASALNVHPNTLYRRLERVRELLGRGWEEPDRRLQLQLAMTLRKLSLD